MNSTLNIYSSNMQLISHIDLAVSLYTYCFGFTVAQRHINKTSLGPEMTSVSQNMLAKQAKFGSKNRKYPVEVMLNSLRRQQKI